MNGNTLTSEHRNNYQNRYQEIRQNLKESLDINPDIPEELALTIKRLLSEEFFDISAIKMALTDYIDKPWGWRIFTLIQSLETNEAFVDAERHIEQH